MVHSLFERFRNDPIRQRREVIRLLDLAEEQRVEWTEKGLEPLILAHPWSQYIGGADLLRKAVKDELEAMRVEAEEGWGRGE